MKRRWDKPEFEHVPLGAEVTAYLGSARDTE
jgi:coenzyme PQQ precursor peptide PqqA